MRLLLAATVMLLAACGGGGGSGGSTSTPPDSGTDTPPATGLDSTLEQLASNRSLTGDPATPRGLQQVTPAQDPLVKLGQLLFFSNTLSGIGDVSCASCHHPDLGGADALSLPIGVSPQVPAMLGDARALDSARDRDPLADGGPNMHRNSQTVFNAALYDRALLYDGRVFVLDEEVVPGGHGQEIRTPETGNLADLTEADGLLEVMSKFPLTNNNEMRGFHFTEISDPESYRMRLVERLRGNVDAEYLAPDAPQNWLSLFRQGFATPDAPPAEVITLVNIQRALAAYIKSMIFVDTPWRHYLDGERTVLSDAAKRGAIAFLTPLDEGGLGCAACHSGDRFTNERFYNLGFPQIGRGFRRAERDDIGRWLTTRDEEDRYAFRVPGLLNVTLTAPYGHAGTFATLEQVIQYHVNPRDAVNAFDFTLSHLRQFDTLSVTYPRAESHTRTALAEPNFTTAEAMLPRRNLGAREMADLVAFLNTLTDVCADNPACRSRWTPSPQEDPDGFMLVRDVNPLSTPASGAPSTPDDYPEQVLLSFPSVASRTTFADVQNCGDGMDSAINAGVSVFTPRHLDPTFGLSLAGLAVARPHGFDLSTWQADRSFINFEATMIAGGVSAAYLDDDCWLDLAYTGGDASGLVFYRNRGVQAGFEAMTLLSDDPGTRYTSVASVDLDGNYRRELFFGNLYAGSVPIYSPLDDGTYQLTAELPMSRHTYGISFGDYNGNGYPDLFLGHWASGGVPGSSPAFWRNGSGNFLQPYDIEAFTSSAYVDQQWNFTPSFADLDRDGHQDLLIASDFGTSMILHNNGTARFDNVTDREVVTDENGMGSALLDYDNDGRLDWFVTSVFDPDQSTEGNWGITGNRLYRNTSSPGNLTFADVTGPSGVRDGNWGWGACAADFNNDGFIDIFHVNGFGYVPGDSFGDPRGPELEAYFYGLTDEFQRIAPRLFINNGDGTFENRATQWGLVFPSEGRGVACLDYDRDGDIDVTLLDHSTGLQFYSNQTGHGPESRFLNIRLVGAPPNTDALGTRVDVISDIGNGHGIQTQMRVSTANSNFNGQNPPDLHFGLGAAASVDLNITWPDGSQLECTSIATNQFLVFDQRDSSPSPQCTLAGPG